MSNSNYNGFGSTAKNAELHANSISRKLATEETECARLRRLMADRDAFIGELRTSLLACIPYVTAGNAGSDLARRRAARLLAKTVEAQEVQP